MFWEKSGQRMQYIGKQKPNLMREVAKLEAKAQAAAKALMRKRNAIETKEQKMMRYKRLLKDKDVTRQEYNDLVKRLEVNHAKAN